MTTITVELTFDQLLDALRKLSSKEREALLKQIDNTETESAFEPDPKHPAFGMWRDRSDITNSATFAQQLRRGIELRQDEGQTY